MTLKSLGVQSIRLDFTIFLKNENLKSALSLTFHTQRARGMHFDTPSPCNIDGWGETPCCGMLVLPNLPGSFSFREGHLDLEFKSFYTNKSVSLKQGLSLKDITRTFVLDKFKSVLSRDTLY